MNFVLKGRFESAAGFRFLSITQTYGPINKIYDKNVPNSIIQDILVYTDYVWPAPAYSVAVNSGVEDAYRDIVHQRNLPMPDYVLPASTFVGAGAATIPIRSAGDAAKTVWLAPLGTTSFVADPTMTTAGGTATSIAVPTSPGEYRLYVVDNQGNRSAQSKSFVRQQAGDDRQNVMIAGQQSGRCLDLPGATTTNGTQVQLWDCHGQANQRFTYTPSKQLMVSGKCLDAYGQGTANGTTVVIWDCNEQTNQQWNFNADDTITGVQSGMCLDASGAGTANGTKIHLWSCLGSANQSWNLRS